MDNSNKIILDLCGGTGAWSDPYRKAGYDVRILTLPDRDITKCWTYGDHFIIYDTTMKYHTKVYYENVYGILFAPPCTQFSRARTTAKTKRDLEQGMILVKAGMEIIWKVQEAQGKTTPNGIPTLKFWAIENPVGSLGRFIGRPIFTFNPSDFGDRYTKLTGLTGLFNNPKKKPVEITGEEKELLKDNNRKMPEMKGASYADRRAITPPGFAEAFYRANR